MPRTLLAVSIAVVVALSVAPLSVGAFAPSRPEQAGFAEHRVLIDRLVKEGTLLLGGPLLTDFESRKLGGAVWIVKAESAEAARKLVESDSFVQNGFVKITAARAFLPTAGSLLPAATTAPPPAK